MDLSKLLSWKLLMAIIATVAISLFILEKNSIRVEDIPQGDVFCTMDAKICPDGGAVGRIPPKCEFAICPATRSGERN